MIGGNINLDLKVKTGKYTINDIGERVSEVIDYMSLFGFLDMSTSDTKHTTYNTKLEESDYLFICDYVELEEINGKIPKTSQLTAICNNKEFDVLLIDNPMELNQHLEIYLRYKGE